MPPLPRNSADYAVRHLAESAVRRRRLCGAFRHRLRARLRDESAVYEN